MSKTPVVKARKLVNALKRLGFFLDRQRGSHAVYRHADGRIVVVPMHMGDIPSGTLRGMLEDIHLSIEELKTVL